MELDLGDLTTPMIADACLRCGVPLRCAPPGLLPLLPGSRLAARVLPARHYGSVDVFFEALEEAGVRLRDQLRFSEFLAARKGNPDLTFRDHLRRIGGAIEE